MPFAMVLRNRLPGWPGDGMLEVEGEEFISASAAGMKEEEMVLSNQTDLTI